MKVNFFRTSSYPNLLAKIKTKQASVGVVGVGYVGRALVEGMSASGIKSYGFDIDKYGYGITPITPMAPT